MANLLRGEIKGALARFCICQIDLRVDLVGLQLADDPLRSADTDLGLGNGFGADLKMLGNVLKQDRGAQSDFRRLLVRKREPEPCRQQQGQHFQTEVLQDVTLEECNHGRGSESARGSRPRCGEGSVRGESMAASSSPLRAIAVGRVTGAM